MLDLEDPLAPYEWLSFQGVPTVRDVSFRLKAPISLCMALVHGAAYGRK